MLHWLMLDSREYDKKNLAHVISYLWWASAKHINKPITQEQIQKHNCKIKNAIAKPENITAN